MGLGISARHRSRRRNGSGALPRGEDAGAGDKLDDRRWCGPLADRSGRRSEGHHRSAESGSRARAGCQDQHLGPAVEAAASSDSEPEVHEDYVSAYDLGRFAESARFVRHYPEQNPVLRDLLPTIATPTQIVDGRDDDLVPWSNNQYLHDLLPNSEIHPLDAGHFAWEQAGEEYGNMVADWVGGDISASEASELRSMWQHVSACDLKRSRKDARKSLSGPGQHAEHERSGTRSP
jgi:pimeloyl-ACP methyl ester carboxylesterase